MGIATFLILVFAFVFAVLAAASAPGVGRVNWLGLALAAFILTFVLRAIPL